MEESKTIVIRIDSNDAGTVYDISNYLKKRLPSKCKVTPDKDEWSVSVAGMEKQAVEIAMAKYAKGFSNGGGHGGYRLSYAIKEVVFSEREILEKRIRAEREGEIAALKQKQAELEAKWGTERKNLEGAVAALRRTIKQEHKALKDAKTTLDLTQSRLLDTSRELSESREENDEFSRQREEHRRTPLFRILFRRLVRFVRR
jgi:hypothetical protein